MPNRPAVVLVFCLWLGLGAEICHADRELPADSPDSSVVVDTIGFAAPPAENLASRVTNPVDLEKHLYQQPTVALFKSLLVPGLGQIGNRRYTKAAVIIGLEAWFIGSAIHYGGQASDAREKYESFSDASTRNHWYNFLDNKRKNRNKYAWFAGITIFLSMFDAYVDAHLSGAPTDLRNDKFGIDLVETGGRPAAALVYRF